MEEDNTVDLPYLLTWVASPVGVVASYLGVDLASFAVEVEMKVDPDMASDLVEMEVAP